MSKLLLITGSRRIGETGLAYARRVVGRAKELDYSIIVGDASGVDEAVMQECHCLGVTCTVVGAYGRLRRQTSSCNVVRHSGSYIQHDKCMAEQCDLCLAIWNGKSRGTKATYDQAVKLGKETWLVRQRAESSERSAQANSGGVAMTRNNKHIDIWTDGACSGNPGPGGWAAILRWNGRQREVTGHALDTTAPRMELQAVIGGLAALKDVCSVTVYTDARYVIGVMTLGWKRKANGDLLQQLDVLCAKYDVAFKHVRGHAGQPLNERCDELACQEREKARSKVQNCEHPAIANGYCLECQQGIDVEQWRREQNILANCPHADAALELEIDCSGDAQDCGHCAAIYLDAMRRGDVQPSQKQMLDSEAG
jgi:ribonuclease HI